MSRRPASRLTATLLASLAAFTLIGCGGDKHEAAAPQAQEVPAEAAPSQAPPQTAAPAATPQAVAPVVTAQATPPATAQAAPPVEGQAATPAPASDSAAQPAEKPAEQPVDALKWLQDSEARRLDYERHIKEAEADIAIANASVADWERTVLAFKNPFLARPQLSPEDALTVKGLDGKGRVEWADGRLEAARVALDAAQKKLADLKANPPQS